MENRIKAYIVDDEAPAKDELKYLLKTHCPQIEVVGESDNALSALKFLQSDSCDLLFLDIEMPERSGIELAKTLKDNFEAAPFIIFVTAYDQFAIKAFELDAVDYLLKPVSSERLIQAIKKVTKRFEKEISEHELETSRIRNMLEEINELRKGPERITLCQGEKLIPVETSQVIYATVEDKITHIYTTKGKFNFNGTLTEFEEHLASPNFFRGHKSYLINIRSIKSIDIWFNGSYQVILEGIEKPIPVSRNQVKTFKKLLNIR